MPFSMGIGYLYKSSDSSVVASSWDVDSWNFLLKLINIDVETIEPSGITAVYGRLNL